MDKIIVVTLPNCPGCDELRRDIKDKDNVEVCDASREDSECYKIAVKAGVKSVPAVVVVRGKKADACELVKVDGKPVAICGGKEVRL